MRKKLLDELRDELRKARAMLEEAEDLVIKIYRPSGKGITVLSWVGRAIDSIEEAINAVEGRKEKS